MPLLCGAVDGMNTPCQLALSSGPAGAARAPSFVEHAVCWSHGCEVIPPRCLAYTLGRASWAQRRREHSKCIRASKEAWVVQGGDAAGGQRRAIPLCAGTGPRIIYRKPSLSRGIAQRSAERRTQNGQGSGRCVDRGPSDSACVRLIVADPAQQQQRTHNRLTGHCTPGPGVRGKRVGRRRQARVLESCSSPPVQHDVRLAARPQHSHPRPHPHLPHGGCEARLTRRRAALHVSMWCIAVWCCAVVLHGDSKPETRPSAPSSITHRPCHPADSARQ